MSILEELVNHHPYNCLPLRLRQPLNKVHGNHLPSSVWNCNGLQKPWRLDGFILLLLTSCTFCHKSFYILKSQPLDQPINRPRPSSPGPTLFLLLLPSRAFSPLPRKRRSSAGLLPHVAPPSGTYHDMQRRHRPPLLLLYLPVTIKTLKPQASSQI